MGYKDLNETKTVANINGIDIVRSTVQVENKTGRNGKKFNAMAGKFRYERRWNLFLNGQQLVMGMGANRRLADAKKLASNLDLLAMLNRYNEELKQLISAK
jgi:hypothetical protein